MTVVDATMIVLAVVDMTVEVAEVTATSVVADAAAMVKTAVVAADTTVVRSHVLVAAVTADPQANTGCSK
jgi:hypothetical protein